MLNQLPTFLAASFLLAVAPGPDNLYVLTRSIEAGRWRGWAVTAGLCTGLIWHTSLVAGGAAVVFTSTPWAMRLLRIVGGLYLLYLAIRSWRGASRTSPSDSSVDTGRDGVDADDVGIEDPSFVDAPTEKLPSWRSDYVQGVVMNVSNPKVTLFFLAFLPSFVDPALGRPAAQVFGYGCAFAVITATVFGTIAMAADQLRQRFRHPGGQHPGGQHPGGWNRVLPFVSAIVLGSIALHLLLFSHH